MCVLACEDRPLGNTPESDVQSSKDVEKLMSTDSPLSAPPGGENLIKLQG